MENKSKTKPVYTTSKIIGLFSGVILFLLIAIFVDLDPQNRATTYAMAIAVLMATWWITEAIPLSVTALLPVVLFPLFGVMNGKTVSSTYFNHIIFFYH